MRIHDEYLLGIAEVSSAWPDAAMQAQIIASRSYALNHVNSLRAACLCNVDDGGGPYYDQTFAGWIKEADAWGKYWRAAVAATDTTADTGQTILSGMGELHLEIIIDRLRREYGVDCNIGAPQVAYRETISKPWTETYTHKKQSGGSGQYAEVKIVFEPLDRNGGILFENSIVGGSVPKEYIPAVEKGIKAQADTGVLAGFPTVDFKYTLVDGKYHDVDSSALAFEIAAKACFREGMKKASPIILEPIMDVEITTPNDHVGDVVGDLNRRRGQIQNQEVSGSTVIVRALTPLKEMFGYISHLRSMTKGRASFTMQFHHYDPVPRNVADEIMKKSA